MARSFDFNKIKPKTMNVTLSDEEKTTLIITTPDKRLRDELVSLKDTIDEAEEDEVEDVVYELASKVMSRNKNGITITAERLRELYDDITYVLAFLEAYSEFVGELSNSKN